MATAFTFSNYDYTFRRSDNFPGVGEDYLIKIWEQISPDPNIILKIPETFFTNKSQIKNVLSKRKKYWFKPINFIQRATSYVEAKDQFFYDENGRQYLDCVNNISHVGHSNEYVHQAMVSQNLK